MSDNNNNNNANNHGNNRNSDDNSNDARNNNNRNSNHNGNRNNNNNRNDNNRNNGNSANGNKKGACEELGHDVFDCSSRKNIETCEETSKAMAIHVGSGKDCGREASDIKFVLEHQKIQQLMCPQL